MQGRLQDANEITFKTFVDVCHRRKSKLQKKLFLILLGLILMPISHAKSCYTPFGQFLGKAGKTIAYSNCHDDYVSDTDSHLNLNKKTFFTGMKWQCVEYARRWLIENKGFTFENVDYAYQMWAFKEATQINTHIKVAWQHFLNQTTHEKPQYGDLVIYDQSISETGHVGVIVGVENGSILIAEQNYFNLPWVGKHFARRLMLIQDKSGSYRIVDVGVIGWMRVQI